MFPSLRGPRNIMGNNVSVTMCPRLPGPLDIRESIENQSLPHYVSDGLKESASPFSHLTYICDKKVLSLVN